MLCSKKICSSLVWGSKNPKGKGWEQKTHTTMSHVKCTKGHGGPDGEHDAKILWWERASVRMRCNRSKISVMLWHPSKHAVASKLWWIQRVVSLWLELRPKVPRAAAWSAHSLPWLPLWPHTCCMVSRSLRWAKIMDLWHASASCEPGSRFSS